MSTVNVGDTEDCMIVIYGVISRAAVIQSLLKTGNLSVAKINVCILLIRRLCPGWRFTYLQCHRADTASPLIRRHCRVRRPTNAPAKQT